MGIILKDEDSFAPFVQGVSLPLLLLSAVLLPMTLAPAWLRNASRANPLPYVIDTARALFAGRYVVSKGWTGVVVTAVRTGLLAKWDARTFQRTSA